MSNAPAAAPELVIEDARIIFRNFTGAEAMYNQPGDRNFSVVLDEATATQLDVDGWNVKALKVREEGDEPTVYLQVKVSYKNRPPKIVVISSNGRTHLTEETVSILDWADIAKVDLVIRGFVWDVNGKAGIKGYLKTMYVTLSEDALERKYSTLNSSED